MINEKNIYLDIFTLSKNINKYKEIIKNLKINYKNLQVKTPADKKIIKTLVKCFNDIIKGYQKNIDTLKEPLEKREEREREMILNLKRIENYTQEKKDLKIDYENMIFLNPQNKEKLKKELKGFENKLNSFIEIKEKNNQELNYILETNKIINYFKNN